MKEAPVPVVKEISAWKNLINSDSSFDAYKLTQSGPLQFGDSKFTWGGKENCDDGGKVLIKFDELKFFRTIIKNTILVSIYYF